MLERAAIFFMTANQLTGHIWSAKELTFSNLRVGQSINGDVLVILDCLEKGIICGHFLLINSYPKSIADPTHLSRRRSFTEESSL
jgi:hypothetical protein